MTEESLQASLETDEKDAVPDKELACASCLEYRHSLKTLPCNHVFCEHCLQLLITKHGEGDFLCPVCQFKVSNPPGGASGFGFYLAQSRPKDEDEMDAAALLVSSGRHRRLCDSCGEKWCVHSCIECKMVVCHLCEIQHTEKKHTLVKLGGLNRVSRPKTPFHADVTCPEHPGCILSIYCLTCRQLVCTLCKVAAHSRHTVAEMTEAEDAAKKKIVFIQTLVDQHIRLLETVSDDVEQLKTNSQTERTQTAQDIQKRAEEAKALILQQEAAALQTLGDLAARIDQHYAYSLRGLSDMLAGLTAIRTHLAQVLDTGSVTDILRTEENASDYVRQPNQLTKFVAGLPVHAFNIESGGGTSKAVLHEAVTRYIKFPHVTQAIRGLPLVRVVPMFTYSNDFRALVYSLSPTKDGHIWVAHGLNNNTADSIVGLFKEKGELVREERMFGKVKLVRAANHVIAVSDSDCRLLGPKESEARPACWWYSKVIFCKRSIWACTGRTGTEYQIFRVTFTEDGFLILDEKNGFIIKTRQVLTMDASETGSHFAVVDISNVVRIFMNGRGEARASYPPKLPNVTHRIVDICFYRLGGREVLLAADETSRDVTVLDVLGGCRVLYNLAHDTWLLRDVLTLSVDSERKTLWLGCRSGRVLTCGDTAINLSDDDTAVNLSDESPEMLEYYKYYK